MKKIKTFHIYCDVYGTNLFVVINSTRIEFESLLKRRFKIKVSDTYSDERDSLAGCRLDFDKWPYHVIWVSGENKKIDLIPKIAHEVYHHVLRVLVEKGIPTYPDIDNLVMDEPGAYLMEFYMRKILEKL